MAGRSRFRIGDEPGRNAMPWYTAGRKPELQFTDPAGGSRLPEYNTTYAGKSGLALPRAYVTQAPSEGRPGLRSPVFILSTEISCVAPMVVLALINASLSACCDKFGSRSEK